MGNGFWLAVGQMCQLCFWTVRYLPRGDWRQLPRRSLMFGLTIPVLIVFQFLHWIGFALDELFFRKYRKVNIVAPIFVTGIPRSGTTHLQRVLAQHDRLTSMQTWECFLAPSISERFIYRTLGRLLKPCGRLFDRIPLPFFKRMSSIHKLGLNEAEEDFIALLPINACFLLVVLFPESAHYWRLSQFDSAVCTAQRKKILWFYQRLIQKHLYFHGSDKRYLSKNPSFMMWIQSLSTQFSDASFIVCEREAEKTIPSQLSSLQPTWQLFYGTEMPERFSARIVTMLAHYYHYLEQLPFEKVNALRLPMRELVRDLNGTMLKIQHHCDLTNSESFQQVLQTEVCKSQEYKSQHHYQSENAFAWQGMLALFPVSALSRPFL